jgi:hypothetical protein
MPEEWKNTPEGWKTASTGGKITSECRNCTPAIWQITCARVRELVRVLRRPVRVSGNLCACPGGCARGRRLEGVFQRSVRASGYLCAHP